jgi:hypothetical protein
VNYLFFIHFISGNGYPIALHKNLTSFISSSSLVSTSNGFIIISGSSIYSFIIEKKLKKKLNKLKLPHWKSFLFNDETLLLVKYLGSWQKAVNSNEYTRLDKPDGLAASHNQNKSQLQTKLFPSKRLKNKLLWL